MIITNWIFDFGTAIYKAFYPSFLPESTDKIIVMLHAKHSKRNETLAEYYFRTYRYLLGKIKIYEFDTLTIKMRFVGQNEY